MIYRNAYLYLSILFLLTIFAFWPVYFARLTDVAPLIHAHTIFGMIWLGLMINQTRLVRNKRIKEHRNLGKLSYLIVPPFLLTSLIIFRTFLDMDTEFEQMLALQITRPIRSRTPHPPPTSSVPFGKIQTGLHLIVGTDAQYDPNAVHAGNALPVHSVSFRRR